ncbi:MAG: peptidoglycan-binding domain-containing protein [Pseudomonadota bacterium]
MSTKETNYVGAVLAICLTAGCTVVDPGVEAFQASAAVSSIRTQHSVALQCLGRLIEADSARALDIYVEAIPDRTVPRFFRQRGLSRGGAWWIRTAVKRLETNRIRVLIETDTSPMQRRPGTDLLVFSGAWTQLDRRGADRGLAIEVSVGDAAFAIGGDQAFDLIAGDFTTSIDGVVIHASGVGVVVRTSTGEADLLIDDGKYAGAISLNGANVEGTQMAQRQVTEAAVMIHIADYYQLDYRSCLETAWSTPHASKDAVDQFRQMDPAAQARAFQVLLSELGFYKAAVDGIWGQQSREALMAFESEKSLPLSGIPSATLFVALSRATGKAPIGPEPESTASLPESLQTTW